MTALHKAIIDNESKCVRLLLQQNANPNLSGQHWDGTEFENAIDLAKKLRTDDYIMTMLEMAIHGEMVICLTPHTLSYDALSPCALSTNGLRNRLKNGTSKNTF